MMMNSAVVCLTLALFRPAAGARMQAADVRLAAKATPSQLAMKGATTPADDCGWIVTNATMRDTAWRRRWKCKCPPKQMLSGPEATCGEYRAQRYFPLSLSPGACFCLPPRFLSGDDVREADEYLTGSIWSNYFGLFQVIGAAVLDWRRIFSLFGDVTRQGGYIGALLGAYLQMAGSNFVFPNMNFVQGFRQVGGVRGTWHDWTEWAIWGKQPMWKPPVKDETMGVVTYQNYARKHFNKTFPVDFFEYYYTGDRVPSWEDNENHQKGIKLLDTGMAVARAMGREPMDQIRAMEPRFGFDAESLTNAAWRGFAWMGPHDIQYASNGVYGISVVDNLLQKYNTKDTLGILMTDSVFSAHLKYKESDRSFHLDLASLQKYAPIPGYAGMGGGARFSFQNGHLHTEEVRFGGKSYKPSDEWLDDANRAFRENKLIGWRYAEKAVIASLLGMTNLVLHVKDLHLELAAAFQATTVDAFASQPTHPLRRLLDPFIHRSVQATNDNFKLLFDYKAAEFSLAPLPQEEQLRLIDDAIKSNPLVLANLDMERYGALHNMDPAFSQKAAQSDDSVWFWRWHYRALTVQRLFDKMITCWLEHNYWQKDLEVDALAQGWWQSMIEHLPALRRATESHPEWASPDKLTKASVRNVLRTLFTWLAWIHEDVGHAAAAYVYNPVHTPMCVPEDGEGVPLHSWVFNSAAYRGFVFLERAKLLDSPPSFWFGEDGDDKCFADFQAALRELGANDMAFSECDKHGFYTCVDRVETAVSS